MCVNSQPKTLFLSSTSFRRQHKNKRNKSLSRSLSSPCTLPSLSPINQQLSTFSPLLFRSQLHTQTQLPQQQAATAAGNKPPQPPPRKQRLPHSDRCLSPSNRRPPPSASPRPDNPTSTCVSDLSTSSPFPFVPTDPSSDRWPLLLAAPPTDEPHHLPASFLLLPRRPASASRPDPIAGHPVNVAASPPPTTTTLALISTRRRAHLLFLHPTQQPNPPPLHADSVDASTASPLDHAAAAPPLANQRRPHSPAQPSSDAVSLVQPRSTLPLVQIRCAVPQSTRSTQTRGKIPLALIHIFFYSNKSYISICLI